ncbi:MAG: DeoR/GlpR transcriptional regulator [Anaerolineales bacterium]|nr:DeoR/GlpR transcriptional regulator [Anaerolineales bacterium]
MDSLDQKHQTKLLADQRRQRILTSVYEHGSVNTDELAARFDVSSMTIWRDLKILEDAGMIRRIRGGGTLPDGFTAAEPIFQKKQTLNREKKASIAAYAAQHFVQDNHIIILEAGTTAMAMVKYLNQRNLTAITNGLGTLNELAHRLNNINLLSCGGMMREIGYTFVGPQAEQFFKNIRANTLFLSATGLALPEGITDPNPLEIQIKRAMATSAERIVLIMDSTKFGVRSLAEILPLEKVAVLITDSGAPEDFVSELCQMGLDVHIASAGERINEECDE